MKSVESPLEKYFIKKFKELGIEVTPPKTGKKKQKNKQ